MTWLGASLSTDQEDLIAMVATIVAKQGDHASDEAADDPKSAGERRSALIDAGVWTLGVAEDLGGGGAPFDLRQTALAALGRHWPGIAWASVQAHAAAEVLGAGNRPELATKAHEGEPVAVMDLGSSAVDLEEVDGGVQGRVWRLDPAGENPHLVVLVDEATAWFLPAGTVRHTRTLSRTGMAGSMTVSAEVDAAAADTVRLTAPVAAVQARLALGGAAIAAGLAAEAAERSAEYSHARLQFGGPLTNLPTVRKALFDQTRLALESFWLALSAPTSTVAAAAALEGNCERAITAAGAAVQSHGGYGYLTEYGIERLLRDAISLRAACDAASTARTAAAVLVGHTGTTPEATTNRERR